LILLAKSSRSSSSMASFADYVEAHWYARPIEASVILLPIFEFAYANPNFCTVLLESLSPDHEGHISGHSPPLPFTIMSLSSYILTHATSSSEPRAISYANLALHILLVFSNNNRMMSHFCQPTQAIWLCRQVKASVDMLNGLNVSAEITLPTHNDYATTPSLFTFRLLCAMGQT
jgi:hypothetical protein